MCLLIDIETEKYNAFNSLGFTVLIENSLLHQQISELEHFDDYRLLLNTQEILLAPELPTEFFSVNGNESDYLLLL